MTALFDEKALLAELEPLLDDPDFRTGLGNLTGTPFFVAFFLASVSQGEGLGAAAVAMIGQEELAGRIRDLDKQEREERGHEEITLAAGRALLPAWFDGDVYRYPKALQGRDYYVQVLERNRERLKAEGRYSRLNLYLTTTFAYEIMVALLYRAVADGLRGGPLADGLGGKVADVIDRIVAEEDEHLGILDQHVALLETPRKGLSEQACSVLDNLAKITIDDYRLSAEMAVSHVVQMMQRYAEPERLRNQIENCGAEGVK